MNENVTNKTPKRRRWIARLLVSALCILLASSLLFVSVVAENVNSFSLEPWNINSFDEYPRYTIGYWIDSSDSDMGYIRVGILPDRFTLLIEAYSSYDVLVKSFTYITSYVNLYDVSGCSSFGNYIAVCVTIGDGGSSSLSYILGFNWNATLLDTYNFGGRASPSHVFFNGNEFGFTGSVTPTGETVSSPRYFLGDVDLGGAAQPALLYDTSFHTWFFVTNSYYFSVFSHAIAYQSQTSLKTFVPIRVYSGKTTFYRARASMLGAQTSLFLSFDDGIRSSVSASGVSFSFPSANTSYVLILSPGAFVSPSFSSSVVGVSITRASGTSGSNPYLVYATSSEYVPPESSDETTTEPPPESSEGSSADPSGGTKIWGSILNADGSYTSSLLGTLDLSQATEVRAYIGSWTSKDSSFQSETPVPLTFYVYNSEDGPPDIYTFDYHAAGYSLLGDSVSDFTFPDVIGQFFTLPYNGETDLYFPNVAPYGTVLVSTPFGDSFGGRVMFNLVSADSYFRLDFVDEDTFAVVVFNDAGPGFRTNFDLDIRAYREGYRLEDGETSSSRWFYPSFGSSASYTAEYVTESGLYLVFVDSVEDIVYPWEDGTWSDVIGDVNSRIEDISINHALLESLANDAYGKYSFDPMTNQNFIGAVSEFNDIRDSSGGNYILRYIWGMWNIHPFASSMIAIVGTLAIVGFIIRKM